MADKSSSAAPVPVSLSGVPETLLWTLHNRASEARRPNSFLRDPECVRIYESIAYDFERSFGKPDLTHPLRSQIFDRAVLPWLAAHPGGAVVELAAGLETQFQRCDDGRVHWYCVDMPEALAVRERFLPATERCRYIAKSALDLSWMDEIDASRGVCVTAQGLFMYLEPAAVQQLVTAVLERFPGALLVFDTIPHWFSRKTLKGYHKTRHYTAPRMPWGVDCDELEPLLRRWSDRVKELTLVRFDYAFGPAFSWRRWLARLPNERDKVAAVVQVRAAEA
jgi:O-methyltransferase involved in polyketide biosynthesis